MAKSNYFLIDCVCKEGRSSQLNRFNVRPFVCKTAFTQVPIAADSLFFFVFACPGRNCIFARTFLMHEQNLSA